MCFQNLQHMKTQLDTKRRRRKKERKGKERFETNERSRDLNIVKKMSRTRS